MQDERRRARSHWPVTVVALDQGSDDISDVTTVEARIAAMWPLAVEAYALAGITIPAYARTDTPSRVFQPGEKRPDEA